MGTTVSSPIELPHHFEPRSYQAEVLEAYERGARRGVLLWHRRAAKTTVGEHLIVKSALTRVGVHYIITPSFAQGRRVHWEALNHAGERMLLSAIPPALIRS